MSIRITHRQMGLVAAATAAIAVVGVLAVPAAAQDNRPAFVIGVERNMEMTEVAVDSSVSNQGFRILYSMYDNLIRTDYRGDLSLKPALATSWQRLDDRTVELTLRQGVKFHNGEELTSEDVVFTFGPERMSTENSPGYAPTRFAWSKLDRVEAVGKYKVRIISKTPDPILELRIAGWTGQIISKKGFQDAGDWQAWASKAVGTGPFKVTENKVGQYIHMEAFDDYWGGKPNVKSVRWLVIPETSVRIAALAAGEIDIATGLSPDNFADIRRFDELEVVGGPIDNFRVIVFDNRYPVVKDVHVRRAIGLAIDRELIVETLWGGMTGVPISHQWDTFGKMVNPQRTMPRFDPDEAKAELALSNYKGEEIKYCMRNNAYDQEVATAEAMAEMWQAVGLNVSINVLENWAQGQDCAKQGFFNWSNTATYPDPVGAIIRLYGPNSNPQAAGQYKNDEFNRLTEVLETSMDSQTRYDAFQKMLDIFDWDDPPAIILHQNAQFYGKRKNIDWTPYLGHYMDLRPDNLKIED